MMYEPICHVPANKNRRLPLPPNLRCLNKIKVAAVSYLNTKPLLYGIKRHEVLKKIDLIEGHPATIAQLLIDGTADVGLIPVAVIPKLHEWHIVGNYCIGSDGAVASVCIFSDVPIWDIEKVYLDYQSRTSVQLARILLNEFWEKKVVFIDATGEDFRTKIKGTTAGVVIGDRALEQRHLSAYSYDLGKAWKQHTGLPFVFAAWISNKKLPDDFIAAFDEANRHGLDHLSDVIAENDSPFFSLSDYYRTCISYDLDERKKEGLKLFLDKINDDTLSQKVDLI